ncbi:hypothetical protein ABW19_dt0205271 [Dactylella cylindrospora]|nr:hypothetical protein ABW19_dt0205271 [Dactylella cylindrospora]
MEDDVSTLQNPREREASEKITFRFCRECSNMLYPREDRANNRLLFGCRNCNFVEEAASQCVFRNVLSSVAEETAGVTTDVGSDPTASNIVIRLDCLTSIKLTPEEYKKSKYYRHDLEEAHRRRTVDTRDDYSSIGAMYPEKIRPTRSNLLKEEKKTQEKERRRQMIQDGTYNPDEDDADDESRDPFSPETPKTPWEEKRKYLRMLPRWRQSGAPDLPMSPLDDKRRNKEKENDDDDEDTSSPLPSPSPGVTES